MELGKDRRLLAGGIIVGWRLGMRPRVNLCKGAEEEVVKWDRAFIL